MFHCRDTDEREPTSVSWHKAPDDKKSDDMAYDDIKEADLAAGFNYNVIKGLFNLLSKLNWNHALND